jgi:ribosomal 50S subunit-associated protein YjgA (DUF615 family)
MIKLELTVDYVDYDSLVEQLLPRLQQSSSMGSLLPGGATVELVKKWLSTLSQERKEQLTVELLNANRDRLITKGTEALQQQGLEMHLSGAKASIIK